MGADAAIWGLMLGLGASLHCAGMCGPIGCALLSISADPADKPKIISRLAIMQVGRIASYTALGLVFGTFGAGLFRSLDLSAAHMSLQWIAAGVVVWMGLSTAGFVPSLAGFDRALAPLAGVTARARFFLARGGPELDLVSGLVWGLTPCPMVYAAILNSLLLGSTEKGLLMMLTFGLGTAVPVIASSMALFAAAGRKKRPGRVPAGLFLAGAGVVAFLLTAPGSPFCITG